MFVLRSLVNLSDKLIVVLKLRISSEDILLVIKADRKVQPPRKDAQQVSLSTL